MNYLTRYIATRESLSRCRNASVVASKMYQIFLKKTLLIVPKSRLANDYLIGDLNGILNRISHATPAKLSVL